MGNVLQDLGEANQAAEAYGRSLALEDNPATAFNLSKVLIGLGRYHEAFVMAERRLQMAGFAVRRPGPYWLGHSDAGCWWIWSEQGHGDVIQYLRWLLPLLRRGLRIELELDPAMVTLVREGLAWVGGDLRVRGSDEESVPLPDGACQGPLLSLPLLLTDVPFVDESPYLHLASETVRPLQREARLPRIGLVWASGAFLDGHVLERDYRRKSLKGQPFRSLLLALADRPLELVALQFGPDRQLALGSGAFVAALPEQADFLETARLMQDLDLLISVDTAAAHLAGAMGLPVWMLLPWAAEGRWGTARSDTPWYPSMRLLRQPSHNDWYGLIRVVLARLDLWLIDRALSVDH